MTHMLYKITIDAVDGERFYVAGGPDKAELLDFLSRYDHEGSTVTLDWCSTANDTSVPGLSADPERIYRILTGQEVV
jgi:hypothetical protein